MIKRNVAIGTILVLFTLVTSLTFFTASYSMLQSLNPAAAIAAVAVALVGFLWFKKSSG